VTKSGTIYFPIWLAFATGVLEDAGHEVVLTDARPEVSPRTTFWRWAKE
jgi:hypothetical protein